MSNEQNAVLKVLKQLELTEKIFAPVGELSGGQQQRAGIARALYQGCNIFLGDEPVSAVDERQAWNVIKAITNNHETVVLAMHDVQLALSFCSRIIGLSSGKIILDRKSKGMVSSDLAELYGT